jgi:hypothetical protein
VDQARGHRGRPRLLARAPHGRLPGEEHDPPAGPSGSHTDVILSPRASPLQPPPIKPPAPVDDGKAHISHLCQPPPRKTPSASAPVVLPPGFKVFNPRAAPSVSLTAATEPTLSPPVSPIAVCTIALPAVLTNEPLVVPRPPPFGEEASPEWRAFGHLPPGVYTRAMGHRIPAEDLEVLLFHDEMCTVD